jgi:hypothetical protein
MSHIIDVETPYLKRSNMRIGMAICHNIRIPIYLKE